MVSKEFLLQTSEKQKFVRILNVGMFGTAALLAYFLRARLYVLLGVLLAILITHHALLYYIAEKWQSK